MVSNGPGKSREGKKYQVNKLYRTRIIIPIAALLVAVLFIFLRGGDDDTLYRYRQITMDTPVELRFGGVSSQEADQLQEEVFAEIRRLEELFSRTIDESDTSRLNRLAGTGSVEVSPEVVYVTEKALDYARLSDGAFDPTIAPVVDRWGFLGQEFRVPDTEEIEESLALVDYSLVDVNRQSETISLREKGMALELGGIAKGFIIDRALDVLHAAGVKNAFINAGGDIGMIGGRPDGEPWRIGVRHPREETEIIVVLPAQGGAVVTSGDYERTFTEEGVSYHHILDPQTGMPARGVSSVTVMAETALEADALSTAVFVLGPRLGMALAEQLPGVEAVLVTAEMEILISSGLQDTIILQ